MSWGVFDGMDTDAGGPTIHVAPIDEFDLVVGGHVITATCPCGPSVVFVRRPDDASPAAIYSHIEPSWEGALSTAALARRSLRERRSREPGPVQ